VNSKATPKTPHVRPRDGRSWNTSQCESNSRRFYPAHRRRHGDIFRATATFKKGGGGVCVAFFHVFGIVANTFLEIFWSAGFWPAQLNCTKRRAEGFLRLRSARTMMRVRTARRATDQAHCRGQPLRLGFSSFISVGRSNDPSRLEARGVARMVKAASTASRPRFCQ